MAILGRVIQVFGFITILLGSLWAFALHMRIFTDWLGWFFGGFVGFILVETGPLVPFFLWFKRGSFPWPFFYAWLFVIVGSLIVTVGSKLKSYSSEKAKGSDINKAA